MPRKSKQSSAPLPPLPRLRPGILAPPEEADFLFRFAVYGDSQRGVRIHRRIARAIQLSGAAVVLHTGDYVQDGRRGEQWDEQFAGPARGLLKNVLFLGVQGNHDRDSPRYYELLSPPGGKSWFCAVRSPVAFFGLDSNRPLGEESEQIAWLREELRACREPWKVVFFHEAPYSSSWPWPGGSLKTREVLMPLLDEAGAVAVFSGHIHNYERFHRAGIPYFITGGGGDTLAKPEQLPNPYREWTAMLHHFCTADVYPGRLEILARDLAGVPFDGLTVTKAGLREVELPSRRGYDGPRPEKFRALGGRRNQKNQKPWELSFSSSFRQPSSWRE